MATTPRYPSCGCFLSFCLDSGVIWQLVRSIETGHLIASLLSRFARPPQFAAQRPPFKDEDPLDQNLRSSEQPLLFTFFGRVLVPCDLAVVRNNPTWLVQETYKQSTAGPGEVMTPCAPSKRFELPLENMLAVRALLDVLKLVEVQCSVG